MPITEEERAAKRAKKELRSGRRSGATDATRNAAVNAAIWSNGKKKVYDWQKDYIKVPPSVRLQTKCETSEKTPDTASQQSSNKRPRAGDNSEVPVDLTEGDADAATPQTPPPAKRAKTVVTPPAQRAAMMRIATADATKRANMVPAAAANDAAQETVTAEMPGPLLATDDGLISTKKATKATRVVKSKAAPKAKKASPAPATLTTEPKNKASGPPQAAVPPPQQQQQQPTPPASFQSKSPARSTQTAAESKKDAPGPAQAPAPAPAKPPTPAEQQQQERYERTADWIGAVEDPAEEKTENAASPEEVAEFRRALFAGELEDEPQEEKEIVYGELTIDWGGLDPSRRSGGDGVASEPREAAEAEASADDCDLDSLFGGSLPSSASSSSEEAEAEKVADEEESSDDESGDEESDEEEDEEEDEEDDEDDEDEEEEEEEEDASVGLTAAEETDLEAILEKELLGDEEEDEKEEEEDDDDDADEVESVESEEE